MKKTQQTERKHEFKLCASKILKKEKRKMSTFRELSVSLCITGYLSKAVS